MARKRRDLTSAQPKAPRGIDPNDAKIGPIGRFYAFHLLGRGGGEMMLMGGQKHGKMSRMRKTLSIYRGIRYS